jgi:hypothetical protein
MDVSLNSSQSENSRPVTRMAPNEQHSWLTDQLANLGYDYAKNRFNVAHQVNPQSFTVVR